MIPCPVCSHLLLVLISRWAPWWIVEKALCIQNEATLDIMGVYFTSLDLPPPNSISSVACLVEAELGAELLSRAAESPAQQSAFEKAAKMNPFRVKEGSHRFVVISLISLWGAPYFVVFPYSEYPSSLLSCKICGSNLLSHQSHCLSPCDGRSIPAFGILN